MKKLSLIGILLLFVSCQTPVKKENLVKLNGYWEIKEVTMADGKQKEYKVNETVDFFILRQAQYDKKWVGFRQKMMPQLDGHFRTNGIKELIKISDKEDRFFIQYKTKYGVWEEEIIKLEDSVLILKNKENLEYTYKKFTPFSLK